MVADAQAFTDQPEPRRSGRSNKGQHTHNHEILEQQVTTPRKRKSLNAGKSKTKSPAKQASEASAEVDDIIRCVCGQYSEEEDVERDMICCDKCSAWQHNDCMGLAFDRGNEPEQYFCEQCRPEDHRDLLDKMASGEKPWEEVAKQREKAAKKVPKAKSRRGKRGTSSSASGTNKASKASEQNTTVVEPPDTAVTPIVVDEQVKGDSQSSGRTAKRRRVSHIISWFMCEYGLTQRFTIVVQGDK